MFLVKEAIRSITVIIVHGGNRTRSHEIEGFVPVLGGARISTSATEAVFLMRGER